MNCSKFTLKISGYSYSTVNSSSCVVHHGDLETYNWDDDIKTKFFFFSVTDMLSNTKLVMIDHFSGITSSI